VEYVIGACKVELTPLNPYTAGPAIVDPDGRGFSGREEVFQFVRSAIQARPRTPIILYGQRRIGKSSILRQLPNHLPSDILCIFYDLQGKGGMQLDEVLYGLARVIAQVLKVLPPDRREANESTFSTVFLSRAVLALDNHPERLVLLFDEFDVVDERIAGADVAARRFIGYLYNLISQWPQIGYIIVVGRRTEELSREFNSTVLKNAVQQYIGRFDRNHADALVLGLAKNQDSLRFSEAALDRIYSLAAGHPFCTQLLCFTIWSRSISPSKPKVELTTALVEEAVRPSLEYGTNGLNWFFDGITIPAYRLFLSALAETSDPFNGHPVPFSIIEKALLSQQVVLDTRDLSSAPKDLERWDIIARDEAGGFRFQVPLIGAWIRWQRPLELLVREVQYSNPEAYTYYELGKRAYKAGDLERAISDYRGALKVSPRFFDAQRDLASVLRERKGPNDLVEAIEAYERALDLDAEMPTAEFVQTLIDALEAANTEFDRLLNYQKRIYELDIDGLMSPRADRILTNRAFQMMEGGQYQKAKKLFLATHENELAEQAERRRRIMLITNTIIALIGFAAFILRSKLSAELPIETSIFLTALFGASIGHLLLSAAQRDTVAISGARPNATGQSKQISRFIKRQSFTSSIFRFMLGAIVGFVAGYIFLRIFGSQSAFEWVAAIVGIYTLALLIR
jgi:tetratricopeptide (TPR) repeat protein